MSGLENEDKRNRLERESMQKLIEAAFGRWKSAPGDDKFSLLLSGSALVWAERWLLTHPNEVSLGLKNYILRSLARQSQMLSAEWIVERQEHARKDQTYNRIIIVASMLALALVAPKALRDAGLIADEAAPVVAANAPRKPALAEPKMQPEASGTQSAIAVRRPSPMQTSVSDIISDGELFESVTADQLAKLALKEAEKGNRRAGHLLALEYLHADAATSRPQVTTISWGKRQLITEPVNSTTKISNIVSALVTRKRLGATIAEEFAHHQPVLRCGDGSVIAAVTEAGRFTKWDIARGTKIFASERPVSGFSRTSVDHSCATWAGGTDDHEVVLHSTVAGSGAVIIGRHDALLSSMALDATGQRLVSVSSDAILKIWDVRAKRLIREVRGGETAILGAILSPDGRHVLVWSEDKTVVLIDVNSGQKVGSFDGHAARIDKVSFASHGRLILVVSNDGSASVLDGQSLEVIVGVQLPQASVVHGKFSGDGRNLIVIADDGSLYIWDLQRRALSRSISLAHFTFVDAVLNSDSSLLAAVTVEGGVGVWNVATGAQVLGIRNDGPAVATMTFSQDSLELQVISFNGDILTWPMLVDRDAAHKIARRYASSCLSLEERQNLKLDDIMPSWCSSLSAP